MDLNIFDKGYDDAGTLMKGYIGDLKKLLKENIANREKIEREEAARGYDLYETQQIFLDNITRRGNPLAWVMDKDCVCISKDGGGGPYGIEEIEDLPKNLTIGGVYEKIDGKYVHNFEITAKLREVCERFEQEFGLVQ